MSILPGTSEKSDANELNVVGHEFNGQDRLKPYGRKRGREDTSGDAPDKTHESMAADDRPSNITYGQGFDVKIAYKFHYGEIYDDEVFSKKTVHVDAGEIVYASENALGNAEKIKVVYRPGSSDKPWCSSTCFGIYMPLDFLEKKEGNFITSTIPLWDPTVLDGEKPAASEIRPRDESTGLGGVGRAVPVL